MLRLLFWDKFLNIMKYIIIILLANFCTGLTINRHGSPAVVPQHARPVVLNICIVHRRRIRQKRRQRSSLQFGGPTSHLAARMSWRKVYGRTFILGGRWFGVVWIGSSSIFFLTIHSAKCPFFFSSISSNHPGDKSVVRRGTESIPSP